MSKSKMKLWIKTIWIEYDKKKLYKNEIFDWIIDLNGWKTGCFKIKIGLKILNKKDGGCYKRRNRASIGIRLVFPNFINIETSLLLSTIYGPLWRFPYNSPLWWHRSTLYCIPLVKSPRDLSNDAKIFTEKKVGQYVYFSEYSNYSINLICPHHILGLLVFVMLGYSMTCTQIDRSEWDPSNDINTFQ